MGKNRLTRTMGFGNDGSGQVCGHWQYAFSSDGSRKNLDPVGAIPDLLAHSFEGLWRGLHLRRGDVVIFKKSFDVDRSSTFWVKRFPDGENSRPTNLSRGDPPPDVIRVVQNRSNVEHGRETPPGQHLVQLRRNLAERLLLRMK